MIKGSGKAEFRCYTRPGRSVPRRVTAKAAGDFVCRAKASGVPLNELREAVDRCLPCEDDKDRRCERRLEKSLAENLAALQDALEVMKAVEVSMTLLMFLGRFVPILRPAMIPARLALSRVSPATRRLESQIRSNDLLRQQTREMLEQAGFSVIP